MVSEKQFGRPASGTGQRAKRVLILVLVEDGLGDVMRNAVHCSDSAS